MTREVEMKKSLLIICLCFIQAACSTQAVVSDSAPSLLTFSDLANEITVGYRDISTDTPARSDEDEILGTP